MIVAALARHLAIHQPAHGLEVHHPQLRLQQGGLHPLALAGHFAFQQRHHQADRAEQTGGQVRNGNPRAHRSAPGFARDRHHAGDPLRDLVQTRALVVRTILPEPRYAAIDDARIDLAQRLIVDAQLELHVGAIVFNHHIGLAHQVQKQRPPLGMLQVQRHAALIAVRVLVIGELRGTAGLVVLLVAGFLDLDDRGAPIRELAHRRRPGTHPGQVQNREPAQRF
ncbi:hypothetical protein D3C72_1504130 [compost metagenome]